MILSQQLSAKTLYTRHSKSPCSRPLPSILTTNVRSTLNKIDDIYLTLSSGKFQIFAASETWLNDSILDAQISFPNYTPFRCDRQGRTGGGVCVWVQSTLNVQQCEPTNRPAMVEAVWLSFPSSKILFTCIYIPPQISSSDRKIVEDYIQSSTDALLTRFPDFSLILSGDLNKFNVSSLQESLDLSSLVTEPTRASSYLDYFLVSSSLANRFSVTVEAPIANSDHRCISARANNENHRRTSLSKILYDFRQSNVDYFIHSLSQVNWYNFYNSALGIDEKCEIFHNILEELFKRCIPTTRVDIADSDKPWMNPLLKFAIQKRWDAFRRRDFGAYHHWKGKVKHLILQAKRKFASKAQTTPSQFWKLVKSTVACNNSQSSAFSLVNQFESINKAVEVINKEFTSVFSLQTNLSGPQRCQSDVTISWSPQISPIYVEKLLSLVKSSKSMGSDMIPTILYKEAAHLLARPLAHIFSLSIAEQKFPSIWKIAHICPIPKTYPPEVKSLRPIALLPLPSKILEKIVLRSVHQQLVGNFGSTQFGSRPKSSTTCAVISIMHYALTKLESPNVSGVRIVTYDYTKAFDILAHDLIVKQLHEKKFPIRFVKWIENYLSGRSQAVRIGSTISSHSAVTSGVPQGSVMGPLLFCLVVAGLTTVTDDAHLVKYVDDTTLCLPLFKNSSNNHIEVEHRNILTWSAVNGFKVNSKKCKTICYSKDKKCHSNPLTDVTQEEQIRFLGVILNSRLDWKHQIQRICKLASQRIYGLRTLKNMNVSTDNLILVYNAIVRSTLEYASPSFGELPSNLNDRLEKVQKRCHRLICGFGFYEKCECDRFERLSCRRERATLKLFKQATHDTHILNSIIPTRSNRSNRFIQPPTSTTRLRSSFVPHATYLSNRFL